MAKYLDETGLSTLWTKIKNTFALATHTHTKSQVTDFPGIATTSADGLMASTDKTKLNGIATGANAYSHPTTSGNKHIPSGGASGQVLKWSADGTATWGADNNTTYSNFVKSGSTAAAGLVPAPSTTAGTTKYLREDGTWTVPPNTNTTYTLAGLMGSTAKGDTTQPIYWNGSAFANTSYTLGASVPSGAVFTDTTYSAATTSVEGLMSALDKTKINNISSDIDYTITATEYQELLDLLGGE